MEVQLQNETQNFSGASNENENKIEIENVEMDESPPNQASGVAYSQVLSSLEQLNVDPQNPNSTKSKNDLASDLFKLERFDESLKLLQEIKEENEQTLGIYHLETLDTIFTMADVYETQRKYKKAAGTFLEIFELACDVWDDLRMRKCLDVPVSESRIGISKIVASLCDQLKYQKALKIYSRLLPYEQRISGATSEIVKQMRFDMCFLHYKIGDEHEAVATFYQLFNDILQEEIPDDPFFVAPCYVRDYFEYKRSLLQFQDGAEEYMKIKSFDQEKTTMAIYFQCKMRKMSSFR